MWGSESESFLWKNSNQFLQSIDLVHHKFGRSFCLYSIYKWLLSSGEEATEDIFTIEHGEGNLSLAKPFSYALSYTAYSYTKRYRQISHILYISCDRNFSATDQHCIKTLSDNFCYLITHISS